MKGLPMSACSGYFFSLILFPLADRQPLRETSTMQLTESAGRADNQKSVDIVGCV